MLKCVGAAAKSFDSPVPPPLASSVNKALLILLLNILRNKMTVTMATMSTAANIATHVLLMQSSAAAADAPHIVKTDKM